MTALPNASAIVRYVTATVRPLRPRLVAARSLAGLSAQLRALEATAHRWLIAHSIAILRVSLGAVLFVFGMLKYLPGVSPAQSLVEATTDVLTFGLVPGSVALVLVATLECIIGLCLMSGRAVRGAVYLLGVQLVGILSPLVLLPGRLFDGPHGAPTLEGQYVLKDVVLVGVALVIATTLGGGRLTSTPDDDDDA
jgi:uncharacterized membrane protein YphA (DoxX/SURF4 family)